MATPCFCVLIHSCNLLIMMYNEYIESKVLPIEKRGTAMRSKSPVLQRKSMADDVLLRRMKQRTMY